MAAPETSLQPAIESARRGDWKRAEQLVDQTLERAPQASAALYWKSYILFQTGRYKEADGYAARFLEHNPQSGDAHKVLGLALYMQGESVRAEGELTRAVDLSPADFESRYYLGRVQFERHNLPAALASFQRAIALDGASVRAFTQLGQTYEGLARWDEAKAAYNRAIELERQQPKRSEWPYYNLGTLLLKDGRAREAIPWLRQALDRSPSWPEAKVRLAAALGSTANYTEAKRLLEEVVAADPRNGQAHYQLAGLLVKLKQPEDARRHFLLFAELKQR